MKVLFYNTRTDSLKNWGGDTTQLRATQQELEKLGVQVVYGENLRDPAGHEIVHLFNLQRAENGVDLAERAKATGLPVALSTIWWDLSYLDRSSERQFFRRYHPLSNALIRISPSLSFAYRQLRRHVSRRMRREIRARRRLLEIADVLLPNSYAELEILVQQFRMPQLRAKAFVVPNGVTVLPQEEANLRDPWPQLPERYVLEVANCHHLKGQAKVIRALREDRDLPVVFAGDGFDGTDYGTWCRQLGQARGNVFFLGVVPHPSMPLLYRHAGVHVLPSLRESPGLASLEAAAYGANCVVSIHCPVEEYFGKDAFVCDPDDLGSIRQAVLQAWTHPPTSALQSRVLNSFTWARAAQRTYEAYQWITAAARCRQR